MLYQGLTRGCSNIYIFKLFKYFYLFIFYHTCDRFVHLSASDTLEIQKKFRVSSELDTLLVFNENIHRPVASLSMSVIPVQTMKDIITANKYLILPRLSSQVKRTTLFLL